MALMAELASWYKKDLRDVRRWTLREFKVLVDQMRKDK